MLEWQYIADRQQKRQQKTESWGTTILILIIIAPLILFVHMSDQEHERREVEVKSLKTTVAIQSETISGLAKACPGAEMGHPLGRKK